MQSNVRFSDLRAAALAFAGLVAGVAAHADPSKDLGAASPVAMAAPQQCSETDAILSRLSYPTGTMFKLTDASLVVLKQPGTVTVAGWEPEWPNTGN